MPLPPLVDPGPPLTSDQIARYARHLAFPSIGELGQRRLREARVLVLGAGGLGSPVILYLAAAGVGTLGVIDDDVVEVSNLHRQVIHSTATLGLPKVDSAAQAVADGNPEVVVHRHPVRLDESNAESLLSSYDLVVDGSDTFATRYLISDVAARLGMPCVWGSVLGSHAQVSTFWAEPPAGVAGVTLRDVFGAPPPAGAVPSCATGGVIGPVCGAAGSMMAMEVVKLVCGLGDPLLGRVMALDALAGTWREVRVAASVSRAGTALPARTATPAVAARPAPSNPVLTGQHGYDVDAWLTDLDADGLLEALDRGAELIDVREPYETSQGVVPGARAVPLGRFHDGSAFAGPDAVPTDRPVVFICAAGIRSQTAARAARQAGATDIAHLAGGVHAWVSAGQPLEPLT